MTATDILGYNVDPNPSATRSLERFARVVLGLEELVGWKLIFDNLVDEFLN